MRFPELKLSKTKYAVPAVLCVAVVLTLAYVTFFTPLSNADDTQYVLIDDDDSLDSVFQKVEVAAQGKSIMGFTTLMRHTKYARNIRTGRYAINPDDMVFTVFRRIKNGHQSPMMLTIPMVRTAENLAAALSERLMLDSLDLLQLLESEEHCQQLGYDTATIMAMFIPNTYEVFWNISGDKLLERMRKECGNFWNAERTNKAAALEMTPVEVSTLASIIDEETANDAEKPMIAGMYYNRLKADMPLQADPTIKFAKKDFAAKRVYRTWLAIDSPYNTYTNTGLPPGPIRIPSIAAIDAVLNMVHHDYLYMCAKEDFSGTHNFAVTYQEHRKNAAKYAAALNERGIK